MTMPTHGKWTASTAEEAWNGSEEFDTREEAIAYAVSELGQPGQRVYVGQIHEITNAELAESVFDGDRILEDIDQYLYDQVGDEVTNEMPPTTREQLADLEARLAATLAKWLDDNGMKAPCWRIDHVTRHDVPEADAKEQP